MLCQRGSFQRSAATSSRCSRCNLGHWACSRAEHRIFHSLASIAQPRSIQFTVNRNRIQNSIAPRNSGHGLKGRQAEPPTAPALKIASPVGSHAGAWHPAGCFDIGASTVQFLRSQSSWLSPFPSSSETRSSPIRERSLNRSWCRATPIRAYNNDSAVTEIAMSNCQIPPSESVSRLAHLATSYSDHPKVTKLMEHG